MKTHIFTDIYTWNKYIYATTYILIYILTKYRAEIVLMTQSFLFHIRNNSFHDRFISLVQNGDFTTTFSIFPSIITNSETY